MLTGCSLNNAADDVALENLSSPEAVEEAHQPSPAVSGLDLDALVKELAQKLAKGPTKAIGMCKLAMNRSLGMDLETAIEYSQNLLYFSMRTEDYKEGFRAFLEKRTAAFKGK